MSATSRPIRPRDPRSRRPNCHATSALKSTSSPPLPSRNILSHDLEPYSRAEGVVRSMRRVLRLWRIELDFERLLVLVDIEVLPKRLVILRDDLHQDGALRDGWDLDQALLVGAQLPFLANLLAQFRYRVSFDELDDHASAFHRPAARAFHRDGQRSHIRAQNRREQGERKDQCAHSYYHKSYAISGSRNFCSSPAAR